MSDQPERERYSSLEPRRPATIRDVAEAAGVSTSTVSRALSGRIPVQQATLERILHEARRLDYAPNYLAQGLKEGKGRTIGLIVPDITNPVFPAIALGAETEAVRHGYQIYLAHSHENASQEAMLAGMLTRHGVAGLLVATACRGQASPADWSAGGLPVCQLVRRQTDRLCSVTVDQFEVGRLAAERLLSGGRRYPVILYGDQSLVLHQERLQGFVTTWARAGIRLNECRMVDSSRSDEDGVAVTMAMLETVPGSVDCIFAASDMQALGVMRALYLKSLRVPQDIAVIGVDNLGISGLCTPAITCIRQPLQEIGRLGCQRLIERLQQPSSAAGWPVTADKLSSELFQGETG